MPTHQNVTTNPAKRSSSALLVNNVNVNKKMTKQNGQYFVSIALNKRYCPWAWLNTLFNFILRKKYTICP